MSIFSNEKTAAAMNATMKGFGSGLKTKGADLWKKFHTGITGSRARAMKNSLDPQYRNMVDAEEGFIRKHVNLSRDDVLRGTADEYQDFNPVMQGKTEFNKYKLERERVNKTRLATGAVVGFGALASAHMGYNPSEANEELDKKIRDFNLND